VPNREPPHKKDYPVTPAEQRYEMVVLAIASNAAFEASRVELERPGPSYTVETLAELQGRMGGSAKLYFITGADAVLEILTWRSPERLLGSCDFIAVTRPGYDLRRVKDVLGSGAAARVHVLEVPGVHISSTELRRRAGAGESLRYLTPYAVVRYIATHGLYSRGKMDQG
jgi:nicotinate-nucleotide adenylyltransferase